MTTPEMSALADALARARLLLQQHGDTFTAGRMQNLEERISRQDLTAASSAVSEATGGMGSLNDRFLCVENGDAIQPGEVEIVNARLRSLVEEVERRAREAAAVHAIPLSR